MINFAWKISTISSSKALNSIKTNQTNSSKINEKIYSFKKWTRERNETWWRW